jgi:Flp pilus assembly protein TadG
MPPPSEYLRSVEWIAVTWLLSSVALVVLTARAWRSWRRRSLRRLARGEHGAAYSLAYVLTFPLYVYLVALVVESSILLVVKAGTVYGAYAAARSAIVYRSQGVPRANEKARLAAVNAMAPFASSSDLHADGVDRSKQGAADDFARQARKFVQLKGASPGYLPAKYLYADKAVRVSVSKDDEKKPDGLVRVRLTYQAPTFVAGIGRIFGSRSAKGGAYYTVPIVTEVSLPDEAPRSESGKLGIDHATP